MSENFVSYIGSNRVACPLCDADEGTLVVNMNQCGTQFVSCHHYRGLERRCRFTFNSRQWLEMLSWRNSILSSPSSAAVAAPVVDDHRISEYDYCLDGYSWHKNRRVTTKDGVTIYLACGTGGACEI